MANDNYFAGPIVRLPPLSKVASCIFDNVCNIMFFLLVEQGSPSVLHLPLLLLLVSLKYDIRDVLDLDLGLGLVLFPPLGPGQGVHLLLHPLAQPPVPGERGTWGALHVTVQWGGRPGMGGLAPGRKDGCDCRVGDLLRGGEGAGVHLSPAAPGPRPPGPRTLPLLTDPGLQVLAATAPHASRGGLDTSQKHEVVR